MRFVCVVLILIGTAVSALAHVSTYRIKPGDVLEVLVWQEEGLQRQVTVAPDGLISFPLAGHMRAGGLTTREIEHVVTRKLRSFITDPVVTVSYLSSSEEPMEAAVYVTGQVRSGGIHKIDRPTTVMQAISIAGGLDVFAAKRRIKVIRKVRDREVAIEFDYVDVSSGRDLSTNIRLKNGDVVVVPERSLFGGLFE